VIHVVREHPTGCLSETEDVPFIFM